ncbi:MAG: MotA/TolQ/ExbB proton channel family protein, partial [Gemmatimonadota bacterium]
MTLLQLFRDGGIFMYPLLACSILGLAVILVKFVTLRMAKIRTERLLERVESLVRSGKVDQAIDLCANTRGPVASILLTGLHLYEEGSTVRAEQAIAHAG